MAIQIHQLNELTPSVSDYIALDTGADTGKASVSALADAILADYEATFGTGDTATVIDKVNGKVDKAGDTMTGNLTISSENAEDRLIRLQNTVRNVRQEVYATGYWGFYDDTNGEWIIRSDPGSRTINIPHRVLLEGHTSAIGDIYEGSTANNVALTANAWTTVVSNNFSAGSWVITGYVTIPTGNQGAGITITMSSIGSNFARQSVYANGGAWYSANVTGYIKLTENTAITLQVWSASAIKVDNCRIRGMRIA